MANSSQKILAVKKCGPYHGGHNAPERRQKMKHFEEPVIEVVQFSVGDIITASGVEVEGNDSWG